MITVLLLVAIIEPPKFNKTYREQPQHRQKYADDGYTPIFSPEQLERTRLEMESYYEKERQKARKRLNDINEEFFKRNPKYKDRRNEFIGGP
jgi:hypothetical protein